MGRWRHRRRHPRRHPSNPRTLAPLLRERWDVLWRGSGFGRTLLLRRAAAVVLVGVAAVLALAPGEGSAVAVVVAFMCGNFTLANLSTEQPAPTWENTSRLLLCFAASSS